MVILVEMAPRPTEISSSHIEKIRTDAIEVMKVPVSNLKLDSNGLPLVPQPSDHKDDPLVRSSLRVLQTEWLLVLIQIIAELAKLVQILCSALTLRSFVYCTM